ncbi:MAG TPA: Pls/PosA family non-ribosomal peptide synthetase [Cyclobacteriaceae bacterium]|nr:Pls/PosA family non-ribosomal peptide synthetase [Cyclobacteriaceae bacterium]
MIVIPKKSPLLSHYKISSLSFSVAVVIVQLHKYSAYLGNTVALNIRFSMGGKQYNLSKTYSPLNYQTFLSICRKVASDLNPINGNPAPGILSEIELQWFPTQVKNQKEMYLCRLQPHTGWEFLEARFVNIRHGFFEFVFGKATEHYHALAEQLLHNPLFSIEKIDFLSKQDFEVVEAMAYGPVREDISRPELLHNLFEHAVGLNGESVAVFYKGKSITYNQLNDEANRLAEILVRYGIRTGDFVGILLSRCPDLYIAMLAVLKAGAAYVSLDPNFPEERINYVLSDSGAKMVLTGNGHLIKNPPIRCKMLNVSKALSGLNNKDVTKRNPQIIVDPASPAYLIYTSGSTGKPKGVVIPHSAISNLVKSEKEIFSLNSNDRVLQGLSTAFDASIEEIWLAFLSGAALYPVDEGVMVSAAELEQFIKLNNITVVSTIPTLLSLMQPPLPSLRILILGGEYCAHDLLMRWHSENLRIINTYGPTEATVIATYAEFNPHEKTTIGRPLPNYAVFITDRRQNPVPTGVPGELCIGGSGLASGYLNQPELTSAKFINPEFPVRPDFPRRIYRSGDLARFNEKGEVEFLGRIDSQVKLRGYRIELTEIESVLLQMDNIQNAVVMVREDKQQVQHLIAYLIKKNNQASFNESLCRDFLRKKLSAYMIPSAYVILENFPTLPNGKIDKNSLPEPDNEITANNRKIVAPQDDMESAIHKVWRNHFQHRQISIHDDFFIDLGGHSLLAARVISTLRQNIYFQELSIKDLYENPTISKLSEEVRARNKKRVNGKAHMPSGIARNVPGKTEHFLAGIMQFLGLYFIFGYNLFMGIIEYLIFFYFYDLGYSLAFCISICLASVVVTYPALILLAVAAKWCILGKLKPGRHKLWGWFYIRWWFVQNIIHSIRLDYLEGTTILPNIYRLLGMKIGRNVHIETNRFSAFDLISIGDGSSIDEDASVLGYSVKNGFLYLKPVIIGKDCFVGARSVISEGTRMEDGSRITDLTMIPPGKVIPGNETWEGSPAQFLSKEKSGIQPRFPSRSRITIVTIYYALLTFFFPVISIIAFIPGIMILKEINPFDQFLYFMLILPVVGLSFVILFTIEILILKRVFIGKLPSGRYPVHGSYYLKHWILNHLLRMSIDNVGQLHATLHVIPWYRALGVKLGKFVELSTASLSTPDLIHLEDGCTIADEVSLGCPHVEGGWLIIDPVRLGNRTFAGNSAVIPTGSVIGENSLIGVLSVAPGPDKSKPGNATWFGSPAILFPKREPSHGFREEKTYCPPFRLRAARWCFELLRISLPPSGFVFVNVSVIVAALHLYPLIGIPITLILLPFILPASCVTVILGAALIKWIVIGKYKPFNYPLWSNFVWRLELVNALYEFLSTPLILGSLQGTPFLPWYLRLMGSKIGRQCYINTTGFLEWDLVSIGDRTALCNQSVVQTHLFEDRVLKASKLTIGRDCTIGQSSVVLYDTHMGNGSSIGGLSFLMKGESIPEGSFWEGCPAKYAGNEFQLSK